MVGSVVVVGRTRVEELVRSTAVDVVVRCVVRGRAAASVATGAALVHPDTMTATAAAHSVARTFIDDCTRRR
jgi:hypothetical protein